MRLDGLSEVGIAPGALQPEGGSYRAQVAFDGVVELMVELER